MQKLPIYGDGGNVRDWLFVDDHCAAIALVLQRGRLGETYNVGGGRQMPNIELVGLLCDVIDRRFAEDKGLAARFPDCPAANGKSTRALLTFVKDRPGHDRRYAICADKIAQELGFRATTIWPTALYARSIGTWSTKPGGSESEVESTATGWSCITALS